MGKPSSKMTPKTTNNKFWKFCNLADSQKAELFLYGDISQFEKVLDKVKYFDGHWY